MSRGITFRHQLEVMGTNQILIPGCEPTSAMTSDALNRAALCGSALVDLKDALVAIPGSYTLYSHNFGGGHVRKKWFILPTIETECGSGKDVCPKYPDYYDMLRNIATTATTTTTSYDHCDIVGMGYCPSPDFASVSKPLVNPYVTEGTILGLTR
jgi:hypothetical protein